MSRTIIHSNSIARVTSTCLLLLVAMSGCAPAATPSPPAPTATSQPATQIPATAPPTSAPVEEVTLTIWWWGETEAPGAEKWLKESTDLYTEEHPNVHFELVLQTVDNLYPAFKAAAAAKSGPDIQYLWTWIWTLEDVWAGNMAPLSDYVPEEEIAHWLDTESRTFNGKVWTMPWYMLGQIIYYNKDHFEQAGLDPERPPQTWDEFLAACEKLKLAGITPIANGVRDGYGAGAWFDELAKQSLDDPSAYKQVSVGERSWADPVFTPWAEKLAELVNKGCFNEDVNSLDFFQGPEVFRRGEAAITLTNDGFIKQYVEEMGQDVVGVMMTPRFGQGKLAEALIVNAQGLGITSWSPHKEIAADFLVFLHGADRVQSWWDYTGLPMADDRFNTNQVQMPQLKLHYQWLMSQPHLVGSGLIPTQIYEQGVMPAAQMIFQQAGTPTAASQSIEDAAKRWRDSYPPEMNYWVEWSQE